MRRIVSRRSTASIAGLLLTALLASAEIFAADPVIPTDATQMVTRQYPTRAHWIGGKRVQSKVQGKAPR